MKDTKRALRRHHRQRMIRHALRSYVIACVVRGDRSDEYRRKQALRRYDNLKACSCVMCGNPRKFLKQITVQERRLQEAARYEMAVNGGGGWFRESAGRPGG